MRTAVLLLAAASALCQQPSRGKSGALDALTIRMRDYARGLTETPFDVACKIARYDPAGKLSKVTSATHSLELTRGSFKIGSADQPTAWPTNWLIRGRRTVGLEAQGDAGVMFPVGVFAPAKRRDIALKAESSTDGRQVTAEFEPLRPCQSFQASEKGFDFDDIFCARGRIVLDDVGAIPMRSSFEGAGFPVTNGRESMNSFHVESEFTAVSVPGGARPLLFPKKVTADFGFSKGRVTLSCDYTPHPAKPSKKK